LENEKRREKILAKKIIFVEKFQKLFILLVKRRTMV
jgi:hypothetical protein